MEEFIVFHHVSVMLKETIDELDIKEDGIYVDCTLGGAGHALYLLNRYLLNIERDNDISMKHFREIEHVLHPMGGLQERIWNPLQMMNEFGIDAFSPSTYPPLKYTFNQIVIKP